MYGELKDHLQRELADIETAGLFKRERIITTPQDAVIKTTEGAEVLNFCANNYLGLSSHPRVLEAAHKTLDTHGFGMSSVRFICGTQDIHKELEAKIAEFLHTEDFISIQFGAITMHTLNLKTITWLIFRKKHPLRKILEMNMLPAELTISKQVQS